MPDSVPLPAAILGRVSQDKSREARSVGQQQDKNREACEANNWVIPVAGEYQDVGSASRFAAKAREDWPRLLADLEAGRYGVVVMWEPSRGSRKLSEWALFLDTCRDNHILIHVTDHHRTYDLDNPRDWRSLAEDGVDSAYESEKTQRRILRDQAAQAEAGRPHGLVQYGYERIYDEKTRKLIEQRKVEPQSGIAAEIITRIAYHEPLSIIRDDLNERGVPAPAGGKWTPATMRRIAHCPVYIGMRPMGGKRLKNGRYTGEGLEFVPAIWPPIVDEQVWYEAQRVLDDPARLTARPGRQKWLLSYYATCGTCRWPVNVRYARRATSGPVPHYTCTGPRHCLGLIVEAADRQVEARVIAYLSRPDIYPALNRDSGAEAAAARAEAARLRKRLDDAADVYAGGGTLASYKRVETRLKPQIDAAEHRARQLTIPLPLRDILSPEADIEARWDAMPVAVKREVLTALNFTVKIVKAAAPDGWWLKPDDRVKVTVPKRERA